MKRLALIATLIAGCGGPLVEVDCADPKAHPVFSRAPDGSLTYDGCVIDDAPTVADPGASAK